MTVNYM